MSHSTVGEQPRFSKNRKNFFLSLFEFFFTVYIWKSCENRKQPTRQISDSLMMLMVVSMFMLVNFMKRSDADHHPIIHFVTVKKNHYALCLCWLACYSNIILCILVMLIFLRNHSGHGSILYNPKLFFTERQIWHFGKCDRIVTFSVAGKNSLIWIEMTCTACLDLDLGSSLMIT